MKLLRPTGQRISLSLLFLKLIACAAAQNGVPRPDHVLIAIEENRAFSQIIGSASAPYINSLAERGALFTSSFAIRHPSEPNYLALFSGSTHGIGDDSCPHTFTSPNLASELFDAGLTFAGYSESMPHAGYTGCTSGGYARKHNPWVNFTNVPPSANLPFTSFPNNLSDLPTVAFVVPNLDHDMHDGSVSQADTWLHDHLDAYIQWTTSNNSLFVLTWDEGKNGTDNRIVTLFVGPMVRPGQYCERTDHFGVLRTLLEMYGLAPIVQTTNATPITSAWTADSAPSTVTVAIRTPTNDAVSVAPATIALVADASSSAGAISKVEFFERGKKLGEATTSPFSFAWTNVSPGSYCLVATATDAMGVKKTSTSIGILVTQPGQQVVLSPLTVHLTGNGKIVPDLNGQNLQVGRSYVYRAVPDPGNVLALAGTAAAAPRQLSFIMQSNFVLEVTFLPNPFPAVAGAYQGLIYDTNGMAVESSGSWNGSVTANGHFSATMRLGGKSYGLADYFDAFGQAKTKVPTSRAGNVPAGAAKASFEVDLLLDLTNGTDQITGLVKRLWLNRAGGLVQENLFAELFADRTLFNARTNPAPEAGQYTMVYPGTDNPAAGPIGDGFGVVNIDGNGRVRLAGTLADGTKVTQSAALSKHGQWPLYLSLYAGKGTLLGWIDFMDQATNDLQGSVAWIKTTAPTAKYYPDGFANAIWAVGSSYQAPSGPMQAVLSVTNALLTFQGGDLSMSFTNTIRLEGGLTVSNTSANPLALRFVPRTGLFKGTVAPRATAPSIPFRGAVLQRQKSGHGFFLGTNQSGLVKLEAD